jgi:ABC-type Mn2+/Zn2+ transport system permease subunit
MRQFLVTRPSSFAVLGGMIVLVPCVLARVAGHSMIDQVPVLGAILTLLVFLIPGVIAGLIAPRSFFWDGAILGLIAAAFVTFHSFHFRLPNLPALVLFESIGLLLCVTVTACIVGALGGRFVRGHR